MNSSERLESFCKLKVFFNIAWFFFPISPYFEGKSNSSIILMGKHKLQRLTRNLSIALLYNWNAPLSSSRIFFQVVLTLEKLESK
jgi:hypothetical protein